MSYAYDVIDDVINSKNRSFKKIATNHNFWPILMILDGNESWWPKFYLQTVRLVVAAQHGVLAHRGVPAALGALRRAELEARVEGVAEAVEILGVLPPEYM